MPQQIMCSEYTVETRYAVPEGITLLSPEVSGSYYGKKPVPFSWWIRNGVLLWYDANLVLFSIQGERIRCDKPMYSEIEEV